MDLGLPDIDGKQVYEELRKIDANVPIGVLSGYRERKQEMLDMGADGFMIKPILVTEIEKWINDLASKKPA